MPGGLLLQVSKETGEKGSDMVKLGLQKYLAIQGKPDVKGTDALR